MLPRIRPTRPPRVKYVEKDGVVTASTTQTGATWGIDRIDQRDLPLNQTYVYNATGSGVKAYIIDTGINTAHNEFGGRAINGYDAVDGSLPAADCHGHGTHVSGTVGGTTYGMAKGVTLVAVRVLDCSGNGTDSGVVTDRHLAADELHDVILPPTAARAGARALVRPRAPAVRAGGLQPG